MRGWVRKWGGSWFAGLLGMALGVMLGVGGLTLAKRQLPAPIVIAPPAPTATAVPTATPGPLRVYVNGAVTAPGVYALAPGAVVEALIAAAGGFAAGAETAVVNLAQPLRDGMQVYVPLVGEAAPVVAAAAADGGEVGGETAVGGPVNINTATAEALDALPGIGPSTAAQIIAYREANGPFGAIEGIMDVPGIGPAKFEGIRELIMVEP